MAIKLIVEPRKQYTWSEFKKEKPAFSIALDGIVNDAVKRDPNGPYANFDHHSKIDRMSTRSTCAQIQMEINMGLYNTFRVDGIPTVNIYVNDCDEDTCLAVWLLKNPDDVNETIINLLIDFEDKLDCTAGSYPISNEAMRRKIAWIFQPYHLARHTGALQEMGSEEMISIIDNVCARITAYKNGAGEELGLEGQYEIIGGGNGWSFVKENGPASRAAMFADGIQAFVCLIQEQRGRYDYVIGRRSVWIQFDNEEIYEMLNLKEKDIVDKNNKWGGSNTIGGSPRKTGSKIKPKEMEKIITEIFNVDKK